MATDLIPLANAHGFSPDVCSYLTSDIGSFLKNETPLQKMGLSGAPKADVLVFNTNQCRDVKDWFQWYARQWNVPCVGIHTPRGTTDVDDALVDYVAQETESLVEPLEQVAGTKFDIDRLREVVDLSKQCTLLWKQVLKSAAHVPSPITFFDGTIQMGPAVVLRGTPDAVDYYRVLVDELNQRIAQGVAAVENERLRIYWEGMPIWGKLRDMSSQFLQLRICVVASTYCNSWIFSALDPADPMRSMARASLELFITRSEEPKEQYIEEMAGYYGVDGIVFHDCRTCPNNSNTRYGMPRRIAERLGIPTLVLDGDVNDLRCFSDEQSRTNIEGFVEQIADARSAGRRAGER
jgi:benzoyl-CoA reductase/2-hydroxyglutaryl-CoA dehydratase subunit BcrC/BadD/HgdB